jgi:hypothetical protein
MKKKKKKEPSWAYFHLSRMGISYTFVSVNCSQYGQLAKGDFDGIYLPN